VFDYQVLAFRFDLLHGRIDASFRGAEVDRYAYAVLAIRLIICCSGLSGGP
jgi:hypothetical protein